MGSVDPIPGGHLAGDEVAVAIPLLYWPGRHVRAFDPSLRSDLDVRAPPQQGDFLRQPAIVIARPGDQRSAQHPPRHRGADVDQRNSQQPSVVMDASSRTGVAGPPSMAETALRDMSGS